MVNFWWSYFSFRFCHGTRESFIVRYSIFNPSWRWWRMKIIVCTLFSSLMVSLKFIASRWISSSKIHDKKLFSNISRAVNSSFVKFNIIYKKENNLLNKIMNIKEKNHSVLLYLIYLILHKLIILVLQEL